MIIIQTHWCPKCKIVQEEWKVKGSKIKKKVCLGDPWPQNEPIRTEAIDKCLSCGEKIKGQILIKFDENGLPVKVMYVKEVNNG